MNLFYFIDYCLTSDDLIPILVRIGNLSNFPFNSDC